MFHVLQKYITKVLWYSMKLRVNIVNDELAKDRIFCYFELTLYVNDELANYEATIFFFHFVKLIKGNKKLKINYTIILFFNLLYTCYSKLLNLLCPYKITKSLKLLKFHGMFYCFSYHYSEKYAYMFCILSVLLKLKIFLIKWKIIIRVFIFITSLFKNNKCFYLVK